MKKIIIIACGVVIIVIGILSLYFVSTSPNHKGDFSIRDYYQEIENENYNIENQYENITDYKSAAKVGKIAISECFENSQGSFWDWIGCDVRYDEENDAYFIRTYHINPEVNGGAYNVIIRSDGEVLAIWGEK